jgi:hypothetical protein
MSTQNLEMALNTLEFLHPDGGVFELCLINPLASTSPNWAGKAFGKKPIVAGWFRDPAKAADLATRNEAESIHTTLNRCNEALLARADQRLKANVDRTADGHIERIRNLLFDIDPIRPSGISSSDQEHKAALELAQIIRADLRNQGWPEPLVGDSGNGGHLVFPLDLANTQESIDLVKAVLKALSLRYQEHLARLNLEIDQAVFNPARLTKLYGTMARKGDDTPDRPHRLAQIIALPENWVAVPRDLLEKIAQEAGEEEAPGGGKTWQRADNANGKFDVSAYLAHYGVPVVKVKPHGDAVLYCLQTCVFDASHEGNEAAVVQKIDGKLLYQCFHDSCKARTWAEARDRISGHDKLTKFLIGGTHYKDSDQKKSKNREAETGEAKFSKPWNLAARLFPRIPFPWEVLPGDIAHSLQQLGRACATSPTALPGAAFCMVASIMGKILAVSPKEGWEAPLIVWHIDIRESGDGKTPPVRLMVAPLHEAQKEEEKRYQEEMEVYKQLPKRGQDKEPPPAPPRGYFVSDLTLEGLREDLLHSPHGGIVIVQDEISAFLSGQNQYKPKGGTDREAWLALHDGHPARIRRVGRSLFINGARASIFGGIQPKVFRTFFAGQDGLYLTDGTLFRFLVTYEAPTFYDLTPEYWGDQDRDRWEALLQRAMEFVDAEIYARGGKIEKSVRMILTSEAQERFFEWRNQLYSCKDRLPAQLRGFLPKAVEYVLRLTGISHCIQMFSEGRAPQIILSLADLERGIRLVHFYLGQVQDALRLIEEDDYSPSEVSERSLLLAQTLQQLRSHLQDGRLAIGFIHKHYNLIAPDTQKVAKPRGMGAVLRAMKLIISPGKHDANGHRGAKCLVWDEYTETFIKKCLRCLRCLQNQNWQGFEGADIDESMSASSANTSEGFRELEAIGIRLSSPETCTSGGYQDDADIADMVEVEI